MFCSEYIVLVIDADILVTYWSQCQQIGQLSVLHLEIFHVNFFSFTLGAVLYF